MSDGYTTRSIFDQYNNDNDAPRTSSKYECQLFLYPTKLYYGGIVIILMILTCSTSIEYNYRNLRITTTTTTTTSSSSGNTGTTSSTMNLYTMQPQTLVDIRNRTTNHTIPNTSIKNETINIGIICWSYQL